MKCYALLKTQFIKYILNVGLTLNTESKTHSFEVISYYDPNNNQIYLGKSTYIGSGTTDTILLPPGKDNSLSTGRPVHPLEAKRSELIPESEANKMYIQYMNNSNRFQPHYKFKDELPYWHKSRHFPEKVWNHVGYATTAAMFPDKTPEQTKCMNNI